MNAVSGNMHALAGNIWKYYIIRIFGKSLVAPILVVYFLSTGLAKTEIGLIFSIGIYISFLLEVPSGFISDKIGHKRSLIFGTVMKAISVLFYIGGGFWYFVFAEVLFVAGHSLISGTGQAFLFETIKDLNRSEEFEKCYGRSAVVGLSVSSVILMFIPIFYDNHSHLVFFIVFCLLFIPVFTAFTLVQPSYIKAVANGEKGWSLRQELHLISRFIKENKRYRVLILFYAFLGAIQDAIDRFLQLFFSFLQIPTHLFGALYSLNRITQALGSYFAYLFSRALSTIQLIRLFSWQLIVFFFFGASGNYYLGVSTFPLRNFFQGVSTPVASRMINSEITAGYRTTFLSLKSPLSRLIEGTLVFILGVLFDLFPVPRVFLMSAIAVTLLVVLLCLISKRALCSESDYS